MEQRTAKGLPLLAALAAAALTALRVFHLKTAFDENGLLPPGSSALTLTVVASALVFCVFLVLTLRLNRLPGTEACFSASKRWLLPRLTAAALLFAGGATMLLDGTAALTLAQRLIAVGALAAALGMVGTAVSSARGAGLFWPRLLLALFTGAWLVLRFRSWSQDPLVIRVAPLLLAWVCSMVATMLLSGFSLKAGRRRGAVLFGLCAGCFACMTAADYLLELRSGLSELLVLLGVALWCVTAALELLRPEVQNETAPEETERIEN